jgi:hypothetical protein
MTDSILIPGRTICLGGVASNQQAGIGREFLFGSLVSDRRPTVIVMADDKSDDAILRHFSIWAKARGRAFAKHQIVVTDAHLKAADADYFFDLIDRAWKQRPCASPIFYRDMSGVPFKRDRWISFAPELTAIYRAAVLTVCNLGPHQLVSVPILDVPADQHWSCEDNQRHVTLKSVESGDIIEFFGKPVNGGLIWNRKEHAHAA